MCHTKSMGFKDTKSSFFITQLIYAMSYASISFLPGVWVEILNLNVSTAGLDLENRTSNHCQSWPK